jgi:hypothetical protein
MGFGWLTPAHQAMPGKQDTFDYKPTPQARILQKIAL